MFWSLLSVILQLVAASQAGFGSLSLSLSHVDVAKVSTEKEIRWQLDDWAAAWQARKPNRRGWKQKHRSAFSNVEWIEWRRKQKWELRLVFHENHPQNLLCALFFFHVFGASGNLLSQLALWFLCCSIRQDSESPERIRNFLQNVSFGVASNFTAMKLMKLELLEWKWYEHNLMKWCNDDMNRWISRWFRGTYASWAADLPNVAANYAVAAAVLELGSHGFFRRSDTSSLTRWVVRWVGLVDCREVCRAATGVFARIETARWIADTVSTEDVQNCIPESRSVRRHEDMLLGFGQWWRVKWGRPR